MNKQTNYELAIELIGQGMYEIVPEGNKDVNALLNCIDEGYCLIQWPESQEYMEEEWFKEEAIFCGGSEDKTGSSAYFIPIKRLI